MTLRINHNAAAQTGHRMVQRNDHAMGQSLQKLSSGMKINKAADGPAALIISERMRAQIAGIDQAIDNSETARSMVQTTEAALVEVNNALVSMRQLSVHAANEGANDEDMLAADQLELENALQTIDRISKNAQFGTKHLLDGSTSANGVGIGQGLEFVSAGTTTRSSPVEGYAVRVKQLGSRAHMQGTTPLTQDVIDAGEEIVLSEGGKTINFRTKAGDSLDETLGKMRDEIRVAGLDVTVSVDEMNRLQVRHNKYGSEHTFIASTTTAGVLSQTAEELQGATPGKDIEGTIGGEYAIGKGRVLTGGRGTKVEDLAVRYTGDVVTADDAGPEAPIAGRVGVFQNSLQFQVGPDAGQTSSISLLNTNTRQLARGVDNESGFASLSELDVTSQQGAEDAMRLIDQAIDDVTRARARLGAFQKNTVETGLRQLRINMEELSAAESVIRDADMAKEITKFTRNQIMMQSSVAMLAQANQQPQAVLSLLG